MAHRSPPPTPVHDYRANKPELLAHVVAAIGRSRQKRAVFEAVYYHKKRVKAVSEILALTHGVLSNRIRVLQVGNALVTDQVFSQSELEGETAYVQDPVIQGLKAKILRLLDDPKKQSALTTKRNPRSTVTIMLTTRGRSRRVGRTEFVTIDTIDSFIKVRGVAPLTLRKPLPEKTIKNGLTTILKEESHFKDWGGEQNDIYTTTLRLKGKRLRTAFALKGPGRPGVLRPKDMGKNGDQIQRLFKSAADLFLVQHHDGIDQSIVEQMSTHAYRVAKTEERTVYFGTIDGTDTRRLIAAYPKAFGHSSRTP